VVDDPKLDELLFRLVGLIKDDAVVAVVGIPAAVVDVAWPDQPEYSFVGMEIEVAVLPVSELALAVHGKCDPVNRHNFDQRQWDHKYVSTPRPRLNYLVRPIRLHKHHISPIILDKSPVEL
jgi:hypothetical protein